MDLSALIVVIIGTLMFFGFAVWMAFYSRHSAVNGQTPQQTENSNESKSM